MGSSRKKTLEEQLKELQNTVATQAKELVAKDTVIPAPQIQKDVPYFKQFQGGWPIRAIIKQYLRNAGQKLRRDLREEAAAANGGVAPANEDENSDTEDDKDEEAEDLDMDNNDGEDSGINYDTEDSGMDEVAVNDINGVGDEEPPSDDSGVQLNTASWNMKLSDLEEPATPRHRQKDKENLSSDMIKIKTEKQTHSAVPLPPPASTSPKRKALDQGHHVNAGKRVRFVLLSSTR
ncbi:hypothetical protein K438DRAFT_1753340 [Mycena galopus ATCC 62051]|nr:hypothetical protein K438DRAFT_1753340 [Mycena galopus ATCC 62051]